MAVKQLYIGSTRVKLNSAYNAETVAQQYTWFILVVAGRVVLVGEQERLTNGRHVGHVTTSATERRMLLDEVRSTKGGATDTRGAADEGGATDTRGVADEGGATDTRGAVDEGRSDGHAGPGRRWLNRTRPALLGAAAALRHPCRP